MASRRLERVSLLIEAAELHPNTNAGIIKEGTTFNKKKVNAVTPMKTGIAHNKRLIIKRPIFLTPAEYMGLPQDTG
jgi:hypothetical protein